MTHAGHPAQHPAFVTLTVFVPFVVFYMRQPLKLDYLWAALCMLGAVYFMFRDGAGAP